MSRDFGYVSRDPATRKHKCHVFRCDMPARAVARALLETHHREKGKLKESYSALTASESSTASSSTVSGESRGLFLSVSLSLSLCVCHWMDVCRYEVCVEMYTNVSNSTF